MGIMLGGQKKNGEGRPLLSVAPMMGRTDRHDRYFLRQISPSIILYTEMVTTGAILFGDTEKFLRFNDAEHPVVFQLGGSDPGALAECAAVVEAAGYDQINLNVGCPSDRVQNGKFGVCMMLEPELVAESVKSMSSAASVPVTVKTRIGVDDRDSWEFFKRFIDIVSSAGCQTFIIHARKAWLKGLSPKENREIPPLCYETVYRLKDERPDLTIIINGGVTSLEETKQHLDKVNGVMIGRAAYENPWLLVQLESEILKGPVPDSRFSVIENYIGYMESEIAAGTPLYAMVRHLMGLFRGQRGGRLWRRLLTENGIRSEAQCDLLREAVDQMLCVERK